jgi:hypothetical protein
MTDRPCFHVYAIAAGRLGIFASREQAEQSLRDQIAAGTAWDGCEIERWRVWGIPEIEHTEEKP